MAEQLRTQIRDKRAESRTYRRLRRHLNSLPIAFPRTIFGAELRILRRLFSPEEARLALAMDHQPRTAGEIASRLGTTPTMLDPTPTIESRLCDMAAKGAVLRRTSGEDTFALLPFIVGMFEFQAERLTPEFVKDSTDYMKQGFAFEYLTTAKPQTRIIPVQRALPHTNKVAAYDEFEQLIRAAEGHIAVARCICRVTADMNGKPCRHTERRELCLALNDFADTAVREGWGRTLTVSEALECAHQSLSEGLVLQTSNELQPHFICACCGDCCGLLAMLKAVPNPIEHTATNYQVELAPAVCIACGLCVIKCPMDALQLQPAGDSAPLRIAPERCIGCGVCTVVCPVAAVRLVPRATELVPPSTGEELQREIAHTRPNTRRKLRLVRQVLLNKLFRRSVR
ncbi:MAG: 4Fe-4S binding protein [Spirochaeta sp.]|nr:4Fe-4S binding protein [Spirochaeta sp.]